MMTNPYSGRLDLPFTSPPLRENMRLHWRVKALETATLRQAAPLLARHARLPKGLDRVTITLHWQPGTNRRRDVFAGTPTLKALIDGLTDYGLVPDDNSHHVQPSCVVYDWQRDKPAACWLTIKETPGTEVAA